MIPNTLSPEAQVIALLCSRLALSPTDLEAAKPLTAREWSQLSEKVAASSWTPPDLLGKSAAAIARGLQLPAAEAERIARLLARGGHLAIELERLAQRGIWVLTLADASYPAKWKTRLQARAPALLFGAGDQALLSQPAVAVVGSRDADEAAQHFASRVAELCAAASVNIVSGAARGIDRVAMTAALGNSGHAVGVLADDLERTLRDADTRNLVAAGQLALVTQFHYSAPFSIGNAMARNKLIYCLAEFAVVAAASEQTGGTWTGATENLKERWVPLFVRAADDAPAGNSALLKAGALPLFDSELTPELLDLLRERASHIVPAEPRTATQSSFAWNPSQS